MDNLSLNLRIAAIFIVGLASASGVLWPFLLKSTDASESAQFRCMKTCAAGVMLGIALMHLLPDADEDLSDIFPEYGLAFALASAGVVVNLALEQCAMIMLAARRKNKDKNPAAEPEIENKPKNKKALELTQISAVEHGEHCGFVKCEHTSSAAAMEEGRKSDYNAIVSSASNLNGHSHPHNHDDCKKTAEMQFANIKEPEKDLPLLKTESSVGEVIPIKSEVEAEEEEDAEGELLNEVMNAKDLREMISLYAMELSISVHSIIIGYDMGMLAGSGNIATLVSLLCAICFHQFVEGSGLGTILRTMRTKSEGADREGLDSKVLTFIAVFALTTPIGIFIGIMTSSMPQTSAQVGAKGAANALACGSLLYISLAEMVSTYFNASDLNDKPVVKLQMLGTFALGITVMAIIAIWA